MSAIRRTKAKYHDEKSSQFHLNHVELTNALSIMEIARNKTDSAEIGNPILTQEQA